MYKSTYGQVGAKGRRVSRLVKDIRRRPRLEPPAARSTSAHARDNLAQGAIRRH